jgi:hypothetical protein
LRAKALKSRHSGYATCAPVPSKVEGACSARYSTQQLNYKQFKNCRKRFLKTRNEILNIFCQCLKALGKNIPLTAPSPATCFGALRVATDSVTQTSTDV